MPHFCKTWRGQESNWVFWWGGGENNEDDEDAGCDWENHWVLLYRFFFQESETSEDETEDETDSESGSDSDVWSVSEKVNVVVPLESKSDLFYWHWVQDFLSSIAWSWAQKFSFFQWKTSKRESFVALSCCLWVINDAAKTDGNDQRIKKAKQSKEEKTFWQVPDNINEVPKSSAFLPCIFFWRPESIVTLLR